MGPLGGTTWCAFPYSWGCSVVHHNRLLFQGLAPKESDFIFYRFLCRLSELLGMPGLCPGEFSSTLINTQLAGQFMMHAMVSIYAGLIVASPYIIYKLFHFISPALYENERKYSVRVVTSGYLLFIIGVLVNYFIIFPLTFRFLASYQVSLDVQNTIMLSSYIDTLMLLSLLMGIVFCILRSCINTGGMHTLWHL